MNSARFVGPMIGGAITALFGSGWSLAGNYLLGLVVIGAFMALRLKNHAAIKARTSWRRQLATGLSYAYGFRPTRSVLLPLAATSHGTVLRHADALVRQRALLGRLAHAGHHVRSRGPGRCRRDGLPRPVIEHPGPTEGDRLERGTRGRNPHRLYDTAEPVDRADDAVPQRFRDDVYRRGEQHLAAKRGDR